MTSRASLQSYALRELPMPRHYPSDSTLIKELKAYVAEQVGLLCQTDFVQWTPGLPKDPLRGKSCSPAFCAKDRLR